MKNTREIATELRIAHWAEVMKERTESGQSISSYCKSAGIHPNRYFYWQRKLREVAVKSMQTKEPEIVQLAPPGWTQINTAEEIAIESESLTIEIGKCRVPVTGSTDTELLAKVCKVLVSLC